MSETFMHCGVYPPARDVQEPVSYFLISSQFRRRTHSRALSMYSLSVAMAVAPYKGQPSRAT
jgi:hypothetical protein